MMNYIFYHSLLFTNTFFKLFENVKYRDVPVARAMFYSFHRDAVDYFTKHPPPTRRNWHRNKIKLYSQLIASEKVQRVPYRLTSQACKTPKKTIYGPYSIEGLPFQHSQEGIICGQNRTEQSLVRGANFPYCIPEHMSPLNGKAYNMLTRQIKAITNKKNIHPYFRNPSFYSWMINELKPTMRIIDGIHQLFTNNRIKGVVLHSSVHPLGYLLVHMAKQRDIKSMILQYGINDDYQLLSTYPHYYVAWGISHKRRLTQYGVPSGKFVLLGNARFDLIFRFRPKPKAQLAKMLRFSSNKTVFVYPEQPLKRAQNKKAMSTIISALNPYRRKVVLLVKEHPRQRKSSLSPQQLRKYRFIRKVSHRSIHLYDLLKNASAVFTQFSTAGTEAMLMNKPVIALSLFKNTLKHEFSYYAASRSITSAKNLKQLTSIVSKFMRSGRYRHSILKKQRRYRNETYHGTLSATRVKKFINSRLR